MCSKLFNLTWTSDPLSCDHPAFAHCVLSEKCTNMFSKTLLRTFIYCCWKQFFCWGLYFISTHFTLEDFFYILVDCVKSWSYDCWVYKIGSEKVLYSSVSILQLYHWKVPGFMENLWRILIPSGIVIGILQCRVSNLLNLMSTELFSRWSSEHHYKRICKIGE